MFLLPFKTKNPPESPPYSTFALIGINVLIYAITSNGLLINEPVIEQFALTHANVSPLTLFSSMFLHGNILHLFGNMWFLWLMGAAVEGRLRALKFIVLYLAAGLTGSCLHLLLTMGADDLPSLGASGAIMGLLGAALWMFPHSKVKVFYFLGVWWYGVWEWRMWAIALYYLGFDLVESALYGLKDGVGHFAHLGGALGGVLMAMALRGKRDDVRVSDAKSELAETRDLRSLDKYELESIAKVQPDNKDVSLAWMIRSLGYGGKPSPECLANFQRHMPVLAREAGVEQIGPVLIVLSQVQGQVPATVLLDAGTRLDREGQPQTALPLLERAYQAPDSNESVQQAALYRLGLVHEAWFRNKDAALEAFREFERRWPMSALEVQVRERIRILSQA